MTEHSVVHGEFSVERVISAPIAKVYRALADKQAKEKWFKGPTDDAEGEHTMDFRVGGQEVNIGKFHDGVVHTFKAIYYDIVPEARVIYAYEMYLDGVRISVSIATIELTSEGDKTKFVLHEYGDFLDGLDRPETREQGTNQLLDILVVSVEEA